MNYKQYHNLIYNATITPYNIMQEINIPSSVYKYRCFSRSIDGIITEDPYWKESVNGICFFSLAKDFNRNDPNDCLLKYNERTIRDTIYRSLNVKGKRQPDVVNLVDRLMKEYIEQIRDNFRIGCFTENPPTEKCMWENENFGGKHTGYCLEYKTNREVLYPGTIILLPILYEREMFDSTCVFRSLIEHGGINNNELEMISLDYNFALIKNKKYIDEKEWRILVVKDKYDSYFDLLNYKKDLSDVVKAIYLGRDYKKCDKDGEKFQYILEICKNKEIILYEMYEENEKLYKHCVYSPFN